MNHSMSSLVFSEERRFSVGVMGDDTVGEGSGGSSGEFGTTG